MDDLIPGECFAGCRIEAVVGRGGMGVVYRATELALQRRVALKVVAPQGVDAGFGERFGREVRLAASIDHPNIVPVYGAGQERERLYLLMRYVDGTDLHALLGDVGRLEPARAAAIVAQLAAGLDAAHAAGLVHRDVKPANVLLTASSGMSTHDHVYLTDFGLTVEVSSDARITTTGNWIGSVDYMAPEQLRAEPIDARTDVYALGGVLHAALTGQAPFRRLTVPQTIAAHLHDPPPRPTALAPVDAVFDAVVGRALAKDPADRYRSAGDLGRAALAAVRGERVTIGERAVARGCAAPHEERTRRLAGATRVAPRPAQPQAAGDADGASRRHRTIRRAPLVLTGALAVGAAVAVIAATAGGGGARQQPASLSVDEIRGVAQDFAVAYGAEDAEALRFTLARDVRRVGPDGGQRRRDDVLAVYRRQFAEASVEGYELDDMQVVRGAAGRAAGRYTVTRAGRDDIRGRVAFGVVREAGRARIALIATQPD